MPVPKTLRNQAEWKDLTSICRVARSYDENGEPKSEVRYFISSLSAGAKRLAEAVRGHWGVGERFALGAGYGILTTTATERKQGTR